MGALAGPTIVAQSLMRILVSSLLVLCMCGPATPSVAIPPSTNATNSTPAPVTAPTPYTAEQIRDACPAGKRLDFNVDAPGKERQVRTMSFVTADANGADVEMATLDSTGHSAEPAKRSHFTWEELREHALFPASATEITSESITVPAGTFDCRLYTVRSVTETRELFRVIEH
jgi:hypothetical protein